METLKYQNFWHNNNNNNNNNNNSSVTVSYSNYCVEINPKGIL
jgi:hypothetical protein